MSPQPDLYKGSLTKGEISNGISKHTEKLSPACLDDNPLDWSWLCWIFYSYVEDWKHFNSLVDAHLPMVGIRYTLTRSYLRANTTTNFTSKSRSTEKPSHSLWQFPWAFPRSLSFAWKLLLYHWQWYCQLFSQNWQAPSFIFRTGMSAKYPSLNNQCLSDVFKLKRIVFDERRREPGTGLHQRRSLKLAADPMGPVVFHNIKSYMFKVKIPSLNILRWACMAFHLYNGSWWRGTPCMWTLFEAATLMQSQGAARLSHRYLWPSELTGKGQQCLLSILQISLYPNCCLCLNDLRGPLEEPTQSVNIYIHEMYRLCYTNLYQQASPSP